MADRPLPIDIRHPLLVKNGDVFLITGQDGDVPPGRAGFGLFYRDCRYLGRYELSLAGTPPLLLASAWGQGFAAEMELTNAPLKDAGERPVAIHTLGLRRKHLVVGEENTVLDVITLRNFDVEPVALPLAFRFAAGFESILALRGTPQEKHGTKEAPLADGDRLRFGYRGADGVLRRLEVRFSVMPIVAPRRSDDTLAHIEVTLAPQESRDLIVSLRVAETGKGEAVSREAPRLPRRREIAAYEARMAEGWLDGFTRVSSSDEALNEVLHRSLSDIRLLRLGRDGRRFTAAGVPWFVGLFGRDTVIPSLQCLAFDREMAAHTARHLAGWQGTATDPRRHEEPGKILHELRVGEMARLGEIPETPSYASIDSTLLFLILVARHAAWTGSLALFEELRPNVDRALAWVAAASARGGGYVTYDGKTKDGAPVNQGWKDSEDGIVREDGSFPEPPIALVEVQGYAYLARIGIAALYRRAGDEAKAERLTAEAAALRQRVNRDFWMDDEGCYCLALESSGHQVRVVSSNAGHVLWTGIADDDKARTTAERLMRDDMFSGWGIRTLSANAVRYNPLAYQTGSIWPFDSALIAAGFRRYGLDGAACRIFSAMLAAARRFPHGRLPEFFAGTARAAALPPAHCPRADPLQAWSSGAVPFMLAELLGLEPDGFAGTLRIRRPMLPESIQQIELLGVKVGTGSVDLRFERATDRLVPQILSVEGALEVEIEAES